MTAAGSTDRFADRVAIVTGSAGGVGAVCARRLAAEPADIAAVVCWLASDEARCITGQSIVVDSGTTAHRPMHAMHAQSAGFVAD